MLKVYKIIFVNSIMFWGYFVPWNVPWWLFNFMKWATQKYFCMYYFALLIFLPCFWVKNSFHGGSNKWWKLFLNFVTMGHVTMGQNNLISLKSITTVSWYFLPCFWVKNSFHGGSNKRWKLFLNFVTMGHVTMGQNNPISFESITTVSWYFLPCFWVKNSFQGGSNKWWKLFLNFVTVGHVTMGQINPIS